MPIRKTYRHGEHLVACEKCGMTYYSSQVRKQWDGVMACSGPGTRNDWEPRHPVDFIRSRGESHGVRDTSTRSETFRTTCNANGRSAFAGLAVAGCSICGLSPSLDKESRV